METSNLKKEVLFYSSTSTYFVMELDAHEYCTIAG
jgi:hypothetical protein